MWQKSQGARNGTEETFNLGLKDKEDFVMCRYSRQREKMGNADRCDIFGVG